MTKKRTTLLDKWKRNNLGTGLFILLIEKDFINC